MSFNDLVTNTKASTNPVANTTNITGGFSSLVANLPPKELTQKQNLQTATVQANQAQAESNKANSFGGILKNTLTGIPKAAVDVYKPLFQPLANIAVNTAKQTWDIYKNTPEKLVEDVKAGSEDIQKGGFVNQGKGELKTGFRVAGDMANAIFAPLSAAIGSTLTEFGGQKLLDNSGQVIADKSGITDWKAFQDFALSHPNAGEDFNRILMLALSSGEKGKIDPKQILEDVKTTANKLVAHGKVDYTPEVKPEIPIETKTPETGFNSVMKQPEPSTTPIEGEIQPKTAPETTIIPKTTNLQEIPPELQPLEANLIKQKATKNEFLKQIDEGLKNQNLTKRQTVENIVKSIEKMGKTPTEFYEMVARKLRGLPEPIPKVEKGMYPTIHEGGIVKMVKGEPVKIIDGVDTFIHEGTGGWVVSETTTGRFLADSRTKEGAIAKASFEISNVGVDKFKQLISEKQLSKAQEKPVSQETIKPSKVAKSIETKTIEKGLSEGFKDVAGYDPITIKDQALRASKVMENIDKATQMVKGEIPMEKGLKGEMLIKAMEDHAEATGNVKLLQDIANSPLVSETSAHAQAMRILAERNPDSVVAKLREIKQARELQAEKTSGKKLTKAKSDIVKDIKGKIKEKAPTKQTWSEFVDSIKCNY